MLKKSLAFMLSVLLLLNFAGCMKEFPEEPETASPSLVPYMAGFKSDEENGYWAESFYGLMTADGEVVAEPIYNSYRTLEFGGKTYYCMQITEGEWEDTVYKKSLLISADGEWQVEINDNISALSENRIISEHLDGSFNVYDYSGNKVFSGNENQSVDTTGNGFYNGLLVVFDFLSDNGYTTVVDENGKVVLDKLDYCGPFITGKAVASYDREEGYGIITPEGEWLLEPKYTDIKAVDGKYFIAIDFNREYIYDSDLKLLRERECGWTVEEQNYFFETQGKLVRYYSHMDSPDEYYRDAFTDEIISCGGVYADNYYEGFGFYGTDGGKACVFDVNGKLLNECENAERLDVYDGVYAAVNGDECRWFNSVTHKEIITLDNTDEQGKFASTVGDCNLSVISEVNYKSDANSDSTYHLYDYGKKEFVYRDCEYCEINESGDEFYITVAYADSIRTYDADFNLLIESENLCNK